MNKLLLTLSIFMACSWMCAQTVSDVALQQAVLQLNEAKTDHDYDTLYNKFSEAKTSEKWQANYYAAAAMYLKTNFLLRNSPNKSLAEPNELAQKLATQALASEKNNGEINALLGLIHFQKIRIKASTDPKKELRTATEYMSKAEKTLKDNPRLTFLKYEIAERSGNKTEAIKLYQKAIQEFDTFNPAAGSPNWGRQLIETNE